MGVRHTKTSAFGKKVRVKAQVAEGPGHISLPSQCCTIPQSQSVALHLIPQPANCWELAVCHYSQLRNCCFFKEERKEEREEEGNGEGEREGAAGSLS